MKQKIIAGVLTAGILYAIFLFSLQAMIQLINPKGQVWGLSTGFFLVYMLWANAAITYTIVKIVIWIVK